MNVSDSEKISSILENIGYKKTQNINEANLVLIVMCSVRQSAVDRVFGVADKIKKLQKKNHKVQTILTGCILKKDKKIFSERFNYVINIKDIKKIPKILKNSNYNSSSNSSNYNKLDYLEIIPKCSSKLSALVTISNGCNNFCTYCVVPYTRGRLKCRDHKKIIAETKNFIKNGYKEIWLLGQNVNDYFSPSNKFIGFPELLKMVNDLPGDFKIFFVSPNPKNFSDKLIKTMKICKKFSKYLNLPIQSGDNEILKKMNRPYTAEQYINLVKKIRKAIPDINLSTDVIVGFPSETKKQFNNTVSLFKKIKFNIAYINKYSKRYGTPAFKMEDNVSWQEKKRREKILINIINKK